MTEQNCISPFHSTLTSSRCEIIEPMIYSEQNITGNWVSVIKPYVIVTVGLPGRGKSYISARLSRWLNWKGLKCQIFNLGNYRRSVYGEEIMNANWFDPTNSDLVSKREKLVDSLVADLKNWFEQQNGLVGIIDGTNSTVERRTRITKLLSEFVDSDRILWIENICELEDVILENIRSIKVFNADYNGKSEQESVKDFLERIKAYRTIYTSLDLDRDCDMKFVQMINTGQKKIILNSITSQLDQKLVYFLMNLYQKNITLYLCRHGESVAQVQKIIGTNADITDRGEAFSKKLFEFIEDQTKTEPKVNVFCSALKRSLKTAKPFANKEKYNMKQWSQLNEINGGHFEGSTYEEISKNWPKIYKLRQGNKYTYGWPGGESYRQMVIRLENILLEIERSPRPLLIIAHQGICRGIYAYLMHMLPEDCTELEIKSHTVYKFTNKQNKPQVEKFNLDQ